MLFLQERLKEHNSKKQDEEEDVIMQEKEQISLIVKELECLEINKVVDMKNEMLKIWSRGSVKAEKSW
jgi:hypothetical protein